MKKIILLLFLIIFTMSACATPYSQANKNNSYIYQINEKIKLSGNDGDTLGEITITDAKIIWDEDFKATALDGESIEFSQIVQIYYEYDFDNKTVSTSNFWIENSVGMSIEYLALDCELEKTLSTELEQNELCCTFALKDSVESFNLHYNADFEYQTKPTAIILVNLR